MRRGILCATIVAAFPLAAAGAASEDVPVPGGIEAVARTAGVRFPPDRARFVPEITRLVFEPPLRDRLLASPQPLAARLLAASRFQRALDALATPGVVSIADARRGESRRPLAELLDLAGLRLRERRGVYTVEPVGSDAAGRAGLLAAMGIDVSGLADALNRGDAVTFAVPVDVVPVPLSPAVWSDAILGRSVPAGELLAAILADERASLLCHGLAGLDDPTLEYLASRPAVLRALYAHAPTFAAFGSHLEIRDGRVVTPGEIHAEAARDIWEDLVQARTSDPARFVASLFERRAGRLAYLYDTIAELDRPRRAFALGLWLDDPQARLAHARTMLGAIASAYAEWPAPQRPFVRPIHDFGTLLISVAVHEDGRPRAPAGRRLWERAFDGQTLPDSPARELRDAERMGSIDAAWLATTVATADVRQRGARLMQIAFAYRVFEDAPDSELEDVLVALRGFARYRTVMLGLEQMGIRQPALFAAAARRAEAVGRLTGSRAYVALSQFQGAFAVLVRVAATGAADADAVAGLVTSLMAVPLNADGRFAGSMIEWLRREMLEGDDAAAEEGLIAKLAGPAPAVPRVVDWEGGRYRLDLAAAEAERLRRVRARQGGYSLDAAVRLYAAARSLSASNVDLPEVERLAGVLERLLELLPPKGEISPYEVVPGGAESLPDPHAIVVEERGELLRITRARDLRRAADVAANLLQAADIVVAEVLASFAYAATLGDPDGATLLGGDVTRRHDFGVASRVPGVREIEPWIVPEQHFDPGVPWHVRGSLIGLDGALATLALQRLAGDGLLGPPVLGSNDRETFARSVSFLNPYALRDEERDRIGSALAAGRRRVAGARSPAEIDALAEAVRMDGWRHRALRWTAANEPAAMLELVSLTELFVLGGGDVAGLHGWGAAMTPAWGCLCTRLSAPNTWRFFTGRPQVGILGASVPDVTLHVAAELHELDLPAALARSVVSTAMQQFVDTVRPNDGNDWLALVRGAQAITRERIEDFVAAAAAVGGPLVPVAATAVPER